MDYQHLTRDRSLGSTDVHVSDLAKPSNDKVYPYESTGIKQATNRLRQDKGEVYKGNLHFTAEFVPAMNVSGIKFEAEFRELQNATNEDDSGGSVTETEDGEDVPAGVTIHMGHKKGHTKNLKSTDTTGTTALLEEDEPKTPNTAMPTDDGVELGTEELLTHRKCRYWFVDICQCCPLQNPALSSSTSSADPSTRRLKWMFCWMTATGLLSALSSLEVPMLCGIKSVRASSKNLTLDRSGSDLTSPRTRRRSQSLLNGKVMQSHS
jgi:hypothetical protein